MGCKGGSDDFFKKIAFNEIDGFVQNPKTDFEFYTRRPKYKL
jgi:hypothetical protein